MLSIVSFHAESVAAITRLDVCAEIDLVLLSVYVMVILVSISASIPMLQKSISSRDQNLLIVTSIKTFSGE